MARRIPSGRSLLPSCPLGLPAAFLASVLSLPVAFPLPSCRRPVAFARRSRLSERGGDPIRSEMKWRAKHSALALRALRAPAAFRRFRAFGAFRAFRAFRACRASRAFRAPAACGSPNSAPPESSAVRAVSRTADVDQSLVRRIDRTAKIESSRHRATGRRSSHPTVEAGEENGLEGTTGLDRTGDLQRVRLTS